jgi:hypothetical protein
MHPLDQVAVGVDKGEAALRLKILQSHVSEQRGLAGAGLADDVDMKKAVFEPDAEAAMIAPGIDGADG